MIESLLNRIQSLQAGLQSGEIVRTALLPHGGEILDMQKEQLAEGKSSSGEDIRPYYSEDLRANGGYFKSAQSARNYAGWKVDIGNPYEVGNRNFDAPNLYINGKFYGELGIDFGADAVGVIPRTPYAAGIMAKYGTQTFGLMMSNWMRIFAEKGAYLDLMNEVKQRIYV